MVTYQMETGASKGRRPPMRSGGNTPIKHNRYAAARSRCSWHEGRSFVCFVWCGLPVVSVFEISDYLVHWREAVRTIKISDELYEKLKSFIVDPFDDTPEIVIGRLVEIVNKAKGRSSALDRHDRSESGERPAPAPHREPRHEPQPEPFQELPREPGRELSGGLPYEPIENEVIL
jgi:hypothetical protein